jgi:hypothetical protein
MTINGKSFIRTYSDNGCMVERNGERYAEAIDPTELGRTYTETDERIEDEATAEDYEAALGEMGVEV